MSKTGARASDDNPMGEALARWQALVSAALIWGASARPHPGMSLSGNVAFCPDRVRKPPQERLGPVAKTAPASALGRRG